VHFKRPKKHYGVKGLKKSASEFVLKTPDVDQLHDLTLIT